MFVAAASSATDAVISGPLLVTIGISAAAGLVSFFSPCCPPHVPGYLSYVAGLSGAGSSITARSSTLTQTTVRPRQRRWTTLRSRTLPGQGMFVAGFSAVFTSYGFLFGALGSLLIRHQALPTQSLASSRSFWG